MLWQSPPLGLLTVLLASLPPLSGDTSRKLAGKVGVEVQVSLQPWGPVFIHSSGEASSTQGLDLWPPPPPFFVFNADLRVGDNRIRVDPCVALSATAPTPPSPASSSPERC